MILLSTCSLLRQPLGSPTLALSRSLVERRLRTFSVQFYVVVFGDAPLYLGRQGLLRMCPD